ncbi:MAG: right-handed parallel beta-helix repeat-containing protein [bacterium]
MKSRTLSVMFLMLFVSASGLMADTIPGGNVSGTWYQSHSPYYIAGNITIPYDSTLTIEPGVRVNFLGSSSFTVHGWLEAIGTGTDSIHLAGSDWGSVFFNDAQDSSRMSYCSVSGARIVEVYCRGSSSPVISHSSFIGSASAAIRVLESSSPRISDCRITGSGRGVSWESSADGTISGSTIRGCRNVGVYKETNASLTLVGCIIDSNLTTNLHGGGGVFSRAGSLTLTDCTISNNFSGQGPGGGVCCRNGSVVLTNCTIRGNYAHDGQVLLGGGGIGLVRAAAVLSYCTLYDNFADYRAGAIVIDSGSLDIDHCTIDRNESNCGYPPAGAAIVILGGATTAGITNSIISNNYGIHNMAAVYNQGTLAVAYSDFYNNDSCDILGITPAGFGVLDTINRNGDSCDVYGNIFLNPMFVDTLNYDYHLASGSPCIDAGDPAFPPDPDSTITDMGALFFFQTGLEEGSLPQTVHYRPGPTIVRGVLRLRPSRNPLPEGEGQRVRGHILLVDISGRTVMSLRAGDNDVSRLVSGVYFVKSTIDNRQSHTARVIITR